MLSQARCQLLTGCTKKILRHEKFENSFLRGTPNRRRIREGLPLGRLHRTIEMLKEIVLSELLSPGKWGDFLKR